MKSVFLSLLLMLCGITSNAQDPSSNMSLLSNWAPDSITQYNDIWGYVDCEGREYALLGSKYKIHFLDITNPTNPVEVASFAGGQGTTWRDIKTYRNRAYAVSDNTNEGLMIFDLSELPLEVTKRYHSNDYFGKAHNLFMDEPNGRMYVAGSTAGDLLIFDLSEDPDNPVLLETVSLEGGYVHDLYVRDNIGYCSHLSAGMYVYDFRDPLEIVELGSTTNYLGTVFNHSSWLSEDGNTLVFCDETHGAPVKVADVSDLSDIQVPAGKMFSSTLLGPTETNSIAHNPLIRDGYAFISYYHEGVQVYDINNTDDIKRVAYFDTDTNHTNYDGYIGCWGVYPYLSSGTIIASDINNGLYVLSLDSLALAPNTEDLVPSAETEVVNGPIICQGDSAIISVPYESGLTYVWTKNNEVLPDTGSSLMVQVEGDYQVEVFNGICNAFSTVIEIDTKEAPDLSSMTGDESEFCFGEPYMISAPSGMDSYIWMRDGLVLPNTNNIIQAIETGVYTLLVYKNGCPVFSAPYNLTVNEIPSTAISTVQTAVCIDEAAQLQTSEGAESYIWYKGGNMISTTTEPFFTTEEAGTYTVTLVISDCSETSEEFELVFESLPSNDIGLSGSTTFCEGESVFLTADQNAVAWNWTINGQSLSTSAEIEAIESGYYELTVTNAAGCTSLNEQFVNVVVPPNPNVYLQDGDLISSEAETYQWYIIDQPIEGATSQSYTPEENGMYFVEVTNNLGCTSTSVFFEVTTVSVQTPKSLSNVSLFPNPVTSLLHLEVKNEYSQSLQLELYNASGQMLRQQRFDAVANLSTELELDNLASGLYYVKLLNEEGFSIKKIIKE